MSEARPDGRRETIMTEDSVAAASPLWEAGPVRPLGGRWLLDLRSTRPVYAGELTDADLAEADAIAARLLVDPGPRVLHPLPMRCQWTLIAEWAREIGAQLPLGGEPHASVRYLADAPGDGADILDEPFFG